MSCSNREPCCQAGGALTIEMVPEQSGKGLLHGPSSDDCDGDQATATDALLMTARAREATACWQAAPQQVQGPGCHTGAWLQVLRDTLDMHAVSASSPAAASATPTSTSPALPCSPCPGASVTWGSKARDALVLLYVKSRLP